MYKSKDELPDGVRGCEWPGDCVYIPNDDVTELHTGREVYTSVTPYPRRDENDERRTRYTRIDSLWHEARAAGEWAANKPLLLRIRFGTRGGTQRGRACYTVGCWNKREGFNCNKLDKMKIAHPDCKVESFAVCFELV